MEISLQKRLADIPIRVLEGIAVGIGGILPGVSGGTLCAMFGMYRPLVDCLAHPVRGMRKYGWELFWFVTGMGVGFLGLAGIAAKLLDAYPVPVICSFLGMLAGSLPAQWREAGSSGRNRGDLTGMFVCFAVLFVVLWVLKGDGGIVLPANKWGFVFCGILWGFSVLVPGLSASSLLLFFGLYAPMLLGIAMMTLSVLLPLGIGLVGCVLLFGKLVSKGFEKRFSLLSHCVLGLVSATAVMVAPSPAAWTEGWAPLICFSAGFVAAWMLTRVQKTVR